MWPPSGPTYHRVHGSSRLPDHGAGRDRRFQFGAARAAANPAARLVAADAPFKLWLAGFIGEAILAGLPAEVVTREMIGLTPDPRVVALDSRQPEFAKPISDYIKGVVTDERIALGRRKREAISRLPRIEADYGVPGQVLVAIWGVETGFGAIQGDFDVIRSLATLAADGRRRDWAETQLIAALRIIADGQASRAQLRGSWAGAMGQTQFEPDTYVTTAVDGDGDGRRDIWNSSADALASAANLLTKAGWTRGQSWDREVILPPGFDYGLSEGPRQTPSAWAALGARTADGDGWRAGDRTGLAQLLLPTGVAGPAFLAFPHHFVIRQYNNSTAYALAVGLLADRIGGGAPLVTPWPREDALSLADRIAAQTALARLGYDPGATDGAVGVNTRAALRLWQKARGLPADGYLSPAVVARLRTDAATQH